MSNGRLERRHTTKDIPKLLDPEWIFNDLSLAMEAFSGRETHALVIFLAKVSRVLHQPLNVFVKGQSSSGKNWLITRPLRLMPKGTRDE